MSAASRILAVTPGDPAGIGPEIVWKAVRSGQFRRSPFRLLCFGAAAPFQKLGARVRIHSSDKFPVWGELSPGLINLIPAPEKAPAGKLLPGFQTGWAIIAATQAVLRGDAAALVTGPISKERLQEGGFPYPGHTELLADLCGVPNVTMMLANELLRVTLVTTHIGIADVPEVLSRERLRRTINHTMHHLKNWFGIRKPRIAIAALNPHAGESGLFGDEEIRIITPELQRLRKAARGKYDLIGPLPADTLFAKHLLAEGPRQRYDAVVCMYHDQGLIPVKLLDFKNTVNVTLGLPIVRTSVDHGVAFDIAGKGIADPSSFQAAVRLAMQLAQRKKS